MHQRPPPLSAITIKERDRPTGEASKALAQARRQVSLVSNTTPQSASGTVATLPSDSTPHARHSHLGSHPCVVGRRKTNQVTMSEDYARGRRDGLRLALSVLAAEEAKWAALLGQSRSWRTNATREVRHKTLQVAQQRVRTLLNRLTPKDKDAAQAELTSALDALGL